MPAKNDNAVYLLYRVIVLRGQASLLRGSAFFDSEPEPRKVHMHHAGPLIFAT